MVIGHVPYTSWLYTLYVSLLANEKLETVPKNEWMNLLYFGMKQINSYVKSLSRVRLFVTPWTVAYQAPLSIGFSRHEYWSGLSFPSPEDLQTYMINVKLRGLTFRLIKFIIFSPKDFMKNSMLKRWILVSNKFRFILYLHYFLAVCASYKMILWISVSFYQDIIMFEFP